MDYELELMGIILRIPKNTYSLDAISKVWVDGETVTAKATLSPSDVATARQDFLENVELGDDYDATYVLTEKGREYAERFLSDPSYSLADV